ncbi:hypothetical protein CBG25_04740 [Arsenophonus sp. ENCA]|uniref:hypothetical protein n=1 Tax=Arsenophonus sp. ENCA TaxID=1987579 RepID=UPI000BCE1D1A|nr:hypothetical protein [Arsenophonus sp. ENCA]PAV07707.1 hypothetical protein CBG25_04740 [Arsenophonus sp. ENCA]
MPDLTKRVDAFANLNKFKPKTEPNPTANNDDIEKISIENGFPSREPQEPKRQKRARFNSGEKKRQLNIKVKESSFQRFYDLAEKRGIRVLSDLFDQALAALEKETTNNTGKID